VSALKTFLLVYHGCRHLTVMFHNMSINKTQISHGKIIRYFAYENQKLLHLWDCP